MGDQISKRTAIELIRSLYPSAPIMRRNRERWEKKYKQYIEAEKALEQLPSAQPEPCKDAVSREAVSEWLKQYGQDVLHGKYKFSLMYIWKNLMALPSAQPEQRWIPCSERLPDDSDYRSCMECMDGAVWYCTENGMVGLGYYYDSTKEWSTTDDLDTDGKVIAWMPLPEPYKEEKNEL